MKGMGVIGSDMDENLNETRALRACERSAAAA
jgi:hypothetical protein